MNMQRLRGYLILALSLFIFMMWAINLISLSDIEVEIAGAPGGERTETRVRQVRVQPFLAAYLREAGFTIDWRRSVPASTQYPLLIIDPPERLPSLFQNRLLPWVRSGGHLIFFFTTRQSFVESLGASFGPSLGQRRPALQSPFPVHAEARNFSFSSGFLQAPSRVPFHRFAWSDEGVTPILATWRGNGGIFLIGGEDFLTYDGLGQANNLVWLTRTLEGFSPRRSLYVFDPGLFVQVTSRVTKTLPGTPDRKVKNPYLSLWSLIVANPISWVLVQLFFGLIMYFYTVGRRFNRPLPLASQAPSAGTFLEGMGRLLHRHQAVSWGAGRFLAGFMERLRPRLGLAADAGFDAVVERFSVLFPEHGKRFQGSLQSLSRLASSPDSDPDEVVRHVRTLESIRKELNIHD